MRLFAAIAIILFLLCARLSSAEQSRQSSVQKALIGAWKLVSTEEKLRNGQRRPYPDLGPSASGYLMYTADGHMCVALMNPTRPRWTHDLEQGTDSEKSSAATGYTNYCGAYKVDEKNQIIFHYPEISLYPNFIGTEQKRPYRLDGKRLIFSDVDTGEVERWTIVWEKVNGAPAAEASSQDRSKTEQEVITTVHSRLEAVKRNDTTTWATMVADDMLGPLEGEASTKQAWIKTHASWPSGVKYWYGPLQNVKVRIHDDMAVVSYQARQFNEIGGQTTHVNRWQIETLLRQDNRWLLASVADCVIPSEPVAAKLDPGIYDAYVGDYEWAPALISKIRRDGNNLTELFSTGDRNELLPENETSFFIKGEAAGGSSSRIIFVKDNRGRVTHYLYREMGATDRVVKKIR